MKPLVRPARPGDIERERDIERAAGRRFAHVGMSDIATHEPASPATLAEYVADGRNFVATEHDPGVAVGYALIDVVAGAAHIEQLSVDPAHQGRGFGKSLVEYVELWAYHHGLSWLTLTTFSDIPWNRPLYEHIGFEVIPTVELPDALVQLRESEAALGLDPDIRVCMRRRVSRTRSD